MAENEAIKEFNCGKCSAVDNERMVQCGKCDMWYHYDCVAVNSGVADMSWSCEVCNFNIEEAAGVLGNNPGMANSTGGLRQPQAASSPTTSGDRLQMASTSTTDVRTGFFQPAGVVTSPHTLTDNTRVIYTTKVKPSTSIAATSLLTFPFKQVPQKQVPKQHNATATTQVDLQLKFLEEQQRLQQEFLERKYKILSQIGSDQIQQNTLNTTGNFNFISGPTPSQLAARQAIPRDLPHFHGDPEEWPLFISTFENSTSVAGYSHAENLIRLQACLKGRAKDLVRSKLMLPTMVPEIIQTLKMCFGRPEHILERVIEKARKLPPPKDKLESMIDFALCVKNIYSTMEACKMDAHMNNPMLVKELVDKLSNQYKLNWAMYPKNDSVPIMKTFSEWIFQIADAASTVVSVVPTTKSANVNTHTEDRTTNKLKCYVCDGEHKVSLCNDFKSLPLDKKWDTIKKNNLCRQCLNKHNGKCFSKTECGIDGCKIKHHRLLHKNIDKAASSSSQQNSDVQSNNTKSEIINSHSTTEKNQKEIFRIMPIRLHKKNGFINTYAFLDEGSSVTLIEKDMFDLLDLPGVEQSLCLKWTGNTTREEKSSLRASIDISNIDNGNKFTLYCVNTVKNLDLPQQTLNMKEILGEYPYMKGLPIHSYKNVRPSILIGLNNWSVAVPLKIREGPWNQPIATKTRLGWAVQGYSGNSDQVRLNIHQCDCEKHDHELHKMVKDNFNLEEPTKKSLISQEDNKAMEILKKTCQKVGERYEVGLLWKNEFSVLAESYTTAYKRLMCLNQKFTKEPSLKIVLQNQIDNLLQKGYAKKLSEDEINSTLERVWYLPVFIIKNPNKPGKVRMVWDAAAKSNGVCLNDYIHSGPDLLKSLFDVLLSFRVGKVAVCGDIAEMFHQIKVRDSDMHSQRFIWWDKNDKIDKPSVYVMRALTFGISCAPCIAHYVRDFNAEQFKELPRAVEAIQQNHYVDDFIDSVDNDQQAIELESQVKSTQAAAGFNIRNWTSNINEVISHLQEDHSPDQKPKDLADTEKVLGMYWAPNKDFFVYIFRFARLRREVFSNETTPTKRELLQVLVSIFDPLGLKSCYTTALKILLQEVWRSGIDWDMLLSDYLLPKWQKLKLTIAHIASIETPRCFSPHLNEVAPLNPMSIHRLKLQAAVVGVRLANKMANIKHINFTAVYYWSYSKTVLQWLQNDVKKFQQTEETQWRWVPSEMNAANLAPKLHRRWDFTFWFSGPIILYKDVSTWPYCNNRCERHRISFITRGKLHRKATPLQVGDIVVIIDDNLPRHCWPKGRIIETLMAKDGQVRQASVQTQSGVCKRPTAKMAKLDVGSKEM